MVHQNGIRLVIGIGLIIFTKTRISLKFGFYGRILASCFLYSLHIRFLRVLWEWKTVLTQGTQILIGWIYGKILFYISQYYSQKNFKILKRRSCFLTKHSLRNMNQLIISRGRAGKISDSSVGNEIVVRNRSSYQVPEMFETKASTNENHKCYNSMVQAISRGWGDFSTKVGALCACYHFFLQIQPRC